MKRLFPAITAILLLSFFTALSTNAQTGRSAEYAKALQYLASRGEVYFTFAAGSRDEIALLADGISIADVKEHAVFAYANKVGFARFCGNNVDFTVLTPPGCVPTLIKMLGKTGALAKTALAWDSYPTYDAYVAMMNKFAADYPALCKVEEIGASIQNRKILSVKISDNVAQDEKEPKCFYQSTIHGDEVTGYVLMLRLVDYLLTNYQTSARVRRIVDNMELWINPCANPDGTYYGGNATVAGARRFNSNNVDLNRSFPSPSGSSEAALQPETTLYMDFSKKHHFTLSADFHTAAEIAVYVWGCWAKPHADRDWWVYVCKEWADTVKANGKSGYFTGVDGTGYYNAYNWYVVSGERMNWESYWNQCRDVTIELSMTRLLSAADLPAHWDYQYKCFLNYLEQALYGIRGTVTDSITGRPLMAKVFVVSHDVDSSHVYARLPHGDYYRLINAGTWSLTFTAVDSATGRLDTAGYYPKTIADVKVVNKQATALDVKLRPKKATGVSHASGTVKEPPMTLTQSRCGLQIRVSGTAMTIGIYSVDGRFVRTLPVTANCTRWDGNDRNGNRAGNGCYFIRVGSEGMGHDGSFVLAR